MPENAITENVSKKAVGVSAVCPMLLKNIVLFLPAEKLIHPKILTLFLSNCVFREQWSHNLFSRNCAPNRNL
jgi:hypothetical protein